MILQILAAVILLFFYTVHIGQMVAQRRRGIQTEKNKCRAMLQTNDPGGCCGACPFYFFRFASRRDWMYNRNTKNLGETK